MSDPAVPADSADDHRTGADYRPCSEEHPALGGWHCDLPYEHIGPHLAAIDGYYMWDPEPDSAAGRERPCAAFASCAAEPCDQDAVTELHHTPADDDAHWVPLCGDHRAAAFRGEPIEYVVECHGFVPGVPSA